ncbi:MAG: hypothetical protein LBJ38_03680 [Oscillospiraceae bacterium]|jgi:3-phosphoshikimate 1-carboxyvinyltransferase|nr:hypothetical protein [Oscillospiraceae bacterium]
MAKIFVGNNPLRGTVEVPSSKSILHRALIMAGFSSRCCRVVGVNLCGDVEATIAVLEALGATVEIHGNAFFVHPISGWVKKKRVEIKNIKSGSTFRFFTGIFAALGLNAEFSGEKQFLSRLCSKDIEELQEWGITCNVHGNSIFTSGRLAGGDYRIASQTTSQFISGLMMALPLVGCSGRLEISQDQESFPYIRLTAKVMACFGVPVQVTDSGVVCIPAAGYQAPAEFVVEKDFSAAAFWLVAAALGADITVRLARDSIQGDSTILLLLQRLGVVLQASGEEVWCLDRKFCGGQLDGKDVPDLVPILMVLGALMDGQHLRICNVDRLRFKESDRISVMISNLRAIGAKIRYVDGVLVVEGQKRLPGGVVKSFGDHRVAMSVCIAALGCEAGVEIDELDCVRKSYPGFVDDFLNLGGVIRGI